MKTKRWVFIPKDKNVRKKCVMLSINPCFYTYRVKQKTSFGWSAHIQRLIIVGQTDPVSTEMV